MSHFACADEIANPMNAQQLAIYQQCMKLTHKLNTEIKRSFSNSAAILSLKHAHMDWVRPGIMLYGVSPFETLKPPRTGLEEQLLPVMTLTSELIALKSLKKGDCINLFYG